MQNLLKFLDYAGIDPKLYWRIKTPSEIFEFEIQWRKDHPMPWRLRRVGVLFWQLCKTEDLAKVLEQAGIEVADFEKKLHYTILQQVAFADKIVKESRQILGNDAVDQAIDENHRFMEQLEDVIIALTGAKTSQSKTNDHSKPMLRLISDHEPEKSGNNLLP